MLQQVRLESWSMHSSREPRIACQPYFENTDFTWHFGCKAVTSRDDGENVFKPLSSEATAEKPACLEMFLSKESNQLKFSYSVIQSCSPNFTYQAKCQRAWSGYIKRLRNSVPQDVIAVSLSDLSNNLCHVCSCCGMYGGTLVNILQWGCTFTKGKWTLMLWGPSPHGTDLAHPKVSPIHLRTCI